MTVEKLSFSVNTVATATVSDSLYTMCQRIHNATQLLYNRRGEEPSHVEVSAFLGERGLTINSGNTGQYRVFMSLLGDYGWERIRFENDYVPSGKRVLNKTNLFTAASGLVRFINTLGSGLPAKDLEQLKFNSYRSYLHNCYPEPNKTLFAAPNQQGEVPILKAIPSQFNSQGAIVCAQSELLRYLAFQLWYVYMSH